jgi:hypothetical protein
MKTWLKYLLLLPGVLLAGLLCSCKEELPRSVDNLCSGYWYAPSDESIPMMQFDTDDGVHYWIWRYEPGEGIFYAWNDTGMDGKYAIDIANSTLCLLPDEWYDIYMLSAGILTLNDSNGRNIEMWNLPGDKVTALTESEFRKKYPDAK